MKKLVSFICALVLVMATIFSTACGNKQNIMISGESNVLSQSESESSSGSSDITPPQTSDVALFDLTTQDLVNPVGLDDNPYFGWKMSSSLLGQKQTAYRIVVKDENSETVWDSGKVNSDKSTEIAYAGESLAPSTKYDWYVSVWDKNGGVSSPAHATFETGLKSEHAFDDTSFISYAGDVLPSDTYYTIDYDFTLISLNMGIVFGATDQGNLIMWQLNAENTSNIRIRPHFKSNGNWNVPYEKNITEDLISALGLSSGAEFIGKTAHERIVVNGLTVSTYFGLNENSLTKVLDFNMDKSYPLKKIGFRADGNTANLGEAFDVDNLVVKDQNGNVIYQNDFSEDFIPNGSGESAYSSKNGVMHVDTRPLSGEAYGFFNEPTNLPAYRKNFYVGANIISAKLYTSGLGVYESFINGERVGRLLSDGTTEYHELKPGSTQSGVRKQYSAYDVTHLVSSGENVLSAVVGNGWWCGFITNYYGKETAYLAKLVIKYSNGTEQIINTDTSWKSARVSAILSADIYNGESYDARVSDEWKLPSFDDSTWQNAKANTEFNGVISAYRGSYVKVREDLEQSVKSVTVYSGVTGATENAYGKINVIRTAQSDIFTLNAGETALVDFGQNFAGWECFTVRGERGTLITIDHGEILNDNNGEFSRGNDGPGGSMYDANYRSANAITRYTLRGGEAESYHPSLTYYGFRYIEITATATVTFEKIVGQVVTSVEKTTGNIQTSNELINKLISNIEWGYYSNYLSVPTDCPQRDERYGWTGDVQVFAEAGSYLGFSKSFLEKFMLDMRDLQAQDGTIPGALPTGQADGWGYGGTGWSDALIIVPYTLYSMYGSTLVIEENYSAMQRYIDVFLANSNKLGGRPYWGDWLSYEDNGDQVREILGVAYYAMDAKMMSEMAKAIGNDYDARKYQAVYETEKAFFIERYVNSDGRLIRDEQTVCLYAIYLDLLPNEQSFNAVCEQLADNIARNGYLLQTGFLGTKIILDGLTKAGRVDLAYRVLLSQDNPSWLYSVLQGATTIWERWNSYTIENGFGDVGMNSFNHYSYGAIIAWMYRTMAGIDRGVGFKEIEFAPLPSDYIPTVSASYDSVYGTITASSQINNGVWTYEISAPANTTAKVKLSLSSVETLLVNGKSISELTQADGITYLGTQNGYALFEAVAGNFTFTVSTSEINA